MYAVIQLSSNRHQVIWRGDSSTDLAACSKGAACEQNELRRCKSSDPEFRVYELMPSTGNLTGDAFKDAAIIMRSARFAAAYKLQSHNSRTRKI